MTLLSFLYSAVSFRAASDGLTRCCSVLAVFEGAGVMQVLPCLIFAVLSHLQEGNFQEAVQNKTIAHAGMCMLKVRWYVYCVK